MYAIIDQNIKYWLDSTNFKQEIDRYLWLLDELPKRNIGQDPEFQKAYRKFWAMNSARLSKDYQTKYFQYFEQLKNATKPVTVEKVARYLFKIPAHSEGRQSLQFSFSSKLVHMLDPKQPVYDSKVKSFFFLPISSSEIFEKKMALLLSSYEFLQAEYGRVLEQGLLVQAIKQFRVDFELENNTAYTDEKIIDTLIWAFVKSLNKGTIRDAVYS